MGLIEQFEPLDGLVGRLEEVGVGNGLEQVVEGIDLVAVEGVLLEGSGKDDAGARIDHPREFEPVEFGHLDVEEEEVDLLFGQFLHGLNSTGVFPCQFEEGSLGYIALKQSEGQGFIVYNGTFQFHIKFFCLESSEWGGFSHSMVSRERYSLPEGSTPCCHVYRPG